MRVVILAQDDFAAACLGPLAAHKCEVLALSAGTGTCPIFARRCSELGFAFVSAGIGALSQEAVDLLLAKFNPELMVFIPDTTAELPEAFSAAGAARKLVLRLASELPGAPWPEFAPIWLEQEAALVELVAMGQGGAADEVVASTAVTLCLDETSLTLRMKASEAKATLLAALVSGGGLPLAKPADPAAAAAHAAVPASICLSWDDATVRRFVRARLFPPRGVAEVADPATGDVYCIESLEQYREFRARVVGDGVRENGVQAPYAADTHWYSNVGGSIVKMGDSDIHMPSKKADKRRAAVIPGAAIGARKKLRMNEPLIGPNAERYCTDALSSGWIGVEGPYVKQFEKHLARICGCNAACAVQSGTAALYGAMKALGVTDPSHHVLVPSFTCAACADAVVHAGGRPIPVDCEMDSYGLSVEAVRRALDSSKNILGIVVAPCYGVPARDFYEIYLLCKERGIWLCEDACESYGAMQGIVNADGEVAQVPLGSLATLCVISVRSEKMIGVGEGGAILGNDTTLVARAKWWCSRAPCRGVGLWRVYEHDAVGQNFRMPEMLAAVGCAAAEMLPVMVQRKTSIHGWYEAGFAAHPELKNLRLQKCSPGDDPVWWITAALMPEGISGEQVGMRLMKDYPDIEIRPGFFPLSSMGIFHSPWTKPCPNAERLYSGLVCLPSSNQLAQADVERICGALAESLRAVASEGGKAS